MAKKAMMEAEPVANPVSAEVDPILTLSEAGRRCGKAHTTIAAWIRDGLLTPVKNPRGLFGVRESELNKFLGGSALRPLEVANGRK